MKPIPLFGEGINAYSPTVSAQRRVNCFYDPRKDKDKNGAILRSTPGANFTWVIPNAPIRGWHVVDNILYVVAGSGLYSVTLGGAITSLGLIPAGNSFVSMDDNGVQLGIVDGIALYCYTIVTGSYSQSALNTAGSFGTVTDGNFPNGATSLCFLDGWLIANQPNSGQSYVSGLYDVTLWTNASSLPTYFTKDNTSDYLLANDVLNGAIVSWGQGSIEFSQDVGSFPLPFARINGASQSWGLAALYSRQPFNNTMIFLGQNPDGGVQVMTLNGYVPQQVSTSDVEDIINSFSTYQDATSIVYLAAGHPMYQINFPTGGRSFLYDGLTKAWQEVQTGLAPIARHFANIGIAFGGANYVADSTTGNIYQLSTQAYTDNGVSTKREVVSRHIHDNGNLVTIDELFLDVETGVGLQSGQGSNPQIVMEVSKDGGRTFPIYRTANLGMVGQYRSPRVIWRRLGSAIDFVFRFTVTDPVKFTIMKGSVTTRGMEGKGDPGG